MSDADITAPIPDVLPDRFIIGPGTKVYATSDDPDDATAKARVVAQDHPGEFIAIYQRVVLIRTREDGHGLQVAPT